MNVSEWLNIKFLDWERSEGKRKTISEFAAYLDVAPASLSDWLRGKYDPKGKNLGKIASKLGYEIYDLLEIPRPLPDEIDEKINSLIQAAKLFPPDVQVHVIAVFREILPIIWEQKITDEIQILWMMADMLRRRISPGENAEKMVSLATGIPRAVFPTGIGFNFERTKDNNKRFLDAGIAAAKKIDSAGLEDDSDEADAIILEVFMSYGFQPMNMSGMDFNAPDEQ
jgi:transcriptional regulator with XRE-family HTH domain